MIRTSTVLAILLASTSPAHAGTHLRLSSGPILGTYGDDNGDAVWGKGASLMLTSAPRPLSVVIFAERYDSEIAHEYGGIDFVLDLRHAYLGGGFGKSRLTAPDDYSNRLAPRYHVGPRWSSMWNLAVGLVPRPAAPLGVFMEAKFLVNTNDHFDNDIVLTAGLTLRLGGG